jgi:hypothetical protein
MAWKAPAICQSLKNIPQFLCVSKNIPLQDGVWDPNSALPPTQPMSEFAPSRVILKTQNDNSKTESWTICIRELSRKIKLNHYDEI